MLRLGCRYLEVWTESPIGINYIGIIPQVYQVQEKQITLENDLDKRIYNACVNTLKLCMLEHYVDTPWREQCLNAYDSRNQISTLIKLSIIKVKYAEKLYRAIYHP